MSPHCVTRSLWCMAIYKQYRKSNREIWNTFSERNISISHYDDVIMSAMVSEITSLTIVYSTVYSGVDRRKNQSSASLAFVCGIHRWPVNFPHKWPVTRKIIPFDDVIMNVAIDPIPGSHSTDIVIDLLTENNMTRNAKCILIVN